MDLRLPVVASLLLLCAQSGVAQQHSTTLALSARVVRSCAVNSDANADSSVRLTCSRNATPGVVTSGSSGVTPVPPMQSTSIRFTGSPAPARAIAPLTAAATTTPPEDTAAVAVAAPEAPAANQPVVHEIVTINF